MPVAKDGFWINREAASRNPTFVRNVYKCARDTCAKLESDSVTTTRRLAASNQCKLLSNFSSPLCIDDALFCEAGSTGILCGACAVRQ